jgi:hypothetical protein
VETILKVASYLSFDLEIPDTFVTNAVKDGPR